MATLTIQQINAICDLVQKAWEAKDPNRNKTYNMTESEVKNLVEERLSKLNLSLSTFKFEDMWGKNNDTYNAVKLEEIPKCKKQFCYIREGIYHGENILGLSTDSKRPCMIAAKLDDVESEFLKAGNIQASSTYIKIPLAFHLFDERVLCDWENCYSVPFIVCSTPEEINAWFDKFETYYPRLVKQGERCAEVLNFIKTNGKPFKATMKQYAKRDKEWKEARKSYEEMILKQIKRITKLDELEDDFNE